MTRCKPDPDRKVLVTGKNGADKLTSLTKHMESRPVLGQGKVSAGGASEAVELRISRVKIVDPSNLDCHANPLLEVTCVLACFVDDSDKKWLLLSSEGSDQLTMDDALTMVSHYSKRSNIYGYFEPLKTFLYVVYPKNNHDIAEIMEQLVFDPIKAYRITQFTLMARHNPDRDASTILTPSEFAMLSSLLKSKNKDCEKLLSKDAKDFSENFLTLPYESLYRPLDMTVRETVLLLGEVQGITPTTDRNDPGFSYMWLALWESYSFLHSLGVASYTRKRLDLMGYEF